MWEAVAVAQNTFYVYAFYPARDELIEDQLEAKNVKLAQDDAMLYFPLAQLVVQETKADDPRSLFAQPDL